MYQLNKLLIKIAALFLVTHAASAENVADPDNFPVYQNGKLKIPRVDTPDQAGFFQDATLQFDELTNSWHLLDFKTMPVNAVNIEKVTITNSFPVQAFLHVSDANFI